MAFHNTNVCRNKNITTSGSYQKLASEECSEIIVLGPSGGVYISDGAGDGNPTDGTAFLVPAGDYVTFRGITNSDQLSAKRGSGTPVMYYRTQFYGSMTQR